MKVNKAYDLWSGTYDTAENKTRDLEAKALREVLVPYTFDSILEAGCGTGKNSEWLYGKANSLTCADFSEEMLAFAKRKLEGKLVSFITMDITAEWDVQSKAFDLVTFSLVLEHVNELSGVFAQAARALKKGGMIYLGELHPFKQYKGSKARFDKDEETIVLDCYTHRISEFFNSAKENGLSCTALNEWFDDEKDETAVPRLLTILFKKD